MANKEEKRYEGLVGFFLRVLDKVMGNAPEWGDEAKVAYSDADLAQIRKLEEERKRHGL